MTIQKPKPKVQRAYVTVRNPDGGASKSLTLYETTPEEVIERLKEVSDVPKRTRHAKQLPSVA